MRVSKEKATQNREAILEAASRLYREKGIDGIGISELAKSVGLTHGGFYRQFPGGKEQLASEAVARTFAANIEDWRNAKSVADLVKRYLSKAHIDDWTEGCPVPALAADVGRARGSVSESFTEGVEILIDTLERLTDGDTDAHRRDEALQLLASIAGATLIARAVNKPDLANQIVKSVINQWAS
jgi:TetR/AcrR family transcriptional repressor of nem operon